MNTSRSRVIAQADRLVGLLIRGCFVVACAALVAITCITVYEIFMRYFLDSPTIWVSDATRYLLALVIMFGLPDLTLRQQHVSIDLVSEKLSGWPPYRRILTAIGCLTCLFVAWLVLGVFRSQLGNGIETQGLWQIPRFWITGTILIGFTLAGLAFASLTLKPQNME